MHKHFEVTNNWLQYVSEHSIFNAFYIIDQNIYYNGTLLYNAFFLLSNQRQLTSIYFNVQWIKIMFIRLFKKWI